MPQSAPSPGGTAFAGEVFIEEHSSVSGFCVANVELLLVLCPA